MAYSSYDSFSLQPTGMLSMHCFPLPRDKRTVQFRLPADQAPTTDIYLYIDGQLQAKAFSNNGPMSTPVTFGERFFPKPHDAFAILVSRADISLDGIQPKVSDISLSYNGYKVVAHFQSTLQATIRCADTRALAKAYLNGTKNPEASVRSALERHFTDAADKILGEHREDGLLTPETVVNKLSELRGQIQREALSNMSREYHWISVSQVSFCLSLTNTEEVLQPINNEVRSQEDARHRVFEAVIELLGKPLLTPELTQLIQSYINSQPDFMDENKILDFINRMRPLLRTYPPRLIESVMAQYLQLRGIKEDYSYESML